jgi:hypothetical protein
MNSSLKERLERLGPVRVVAHVPGIPFLEDRPERAIERQGSDLQQQVRPALAARGHRPTW